MSSGTRDSEVHVNTNGVSTTAAYVDWLRANGEIHDDEHVLECDIITSSRIVLADVDGHARVMWASHPDGTIPVDVRKLILEAAYLQIQAAFVIAVGKSA